jgi:tripartite-type tricarboxylate transporter receptor subunit TctC
MKTLVRSLAATAAFVLVLPGAHAQTYPSKPVSLSVPFAAGGPTDTVARALAVSMSKALGGTIVVENVPGAGGTIAPTKLKSAAPDGHSLMLAHIGMSTAPGLYRALPFKPLEDFEFIGQVVDVPMTFIAKKDLPPNDFKAFVDYVKANKDKVSMANAGLGSASHLCGLLFMSTVQADLTTVPYKGTAPAINDLLGGQVDVLCDQTTNTTSHIKSGRIKAYAVTSKVRVPSLPDLPPAADAGLPGFEVNVWHGVYAPKGTPKPVLDKLVAALQAAIADPAFIQRMADLGSVVVTKDKATPDGLKNHLRAEIDKWTPIIKKAGVYAD